MYQKLDVTIKCSKCGSTLAETFTNSYKSGIRCLACGHESVEPIDPYEPQDETVGSNVFIGGPRVDTF